MKSDWDYCGFVEFLREVGSTFALRIACGTGTAAKVLPTSRLVECK